MLGSVAWPMLRRAGYPADVGGAILSAAGIGAILSPPTLGAAAFLIAEFLQISYLEVLVMAIVPTVLYYLSIFLMIEADSRRLRTHGEASHLSLGQLTWQVRLSLHVAHRDCRIHGGGHDGIQSRVLGHTARDRVEFPQAGDGALAAQVAPRAGSRWDWRAVGGRDDRDSRDHRGRRDADGTRLEDCGHYRELALAARSS